MVIQCVSTTKMNWITLKNANMLYYFRSFMLSR